MAKTTEAPKVSYDVSCIDCGCDVLLPLMKLKAFKSFSGDRIQVEWPSRDNQEEFARVACPQCGIVMTIQANGQVNKSGRRLMEGNPGTRKAKAGTKK